MGDESNADATVVGGSSGTAVHAGLVGSEGGGTGYEAHLAKVVVSFGA